MLLDTICRPTPLLPILGCIRGMSIDKLLPPPVSRSSIVGNFLADEMADKSSGGESGHDQEICQWPCSHIAAHILHHYENHKQA